jgi:RimJ/RimL family protein N-acetyltransferase
VIATPRLRLVEATAEFVRAVLAGDRGTASAHAGAAVPEEWPGSQEAIAGLPWHLEGIVRGEQAWRIRLIVADDVVVGSINMKGPPTGGDVEIGWGLIPSARGSGYATEAARAVIEWAFAQPGVTRVTATIPTDNEASLRVGRRLGMSATDEVRRGLPVWQLLSG